MNQFIFIRHGQSQANADGIIADADSPLTDLGVSQAKKAARELINSGITCIICSPYLRARQTAEIIANELGMKPGSIQIVEELSERGWGKYQNTAKNTLERDWYTMSDDPDIEPREKLLNRMKLAINKISSLCESETVLAVGHAVSGFYLVEAAKGIESLSEIADDTYIGNADIVKIDIV